jgi:hypothetical protein
LINLGSGTEKVKMKYVSDGLSHSVTLNHTKKTGYILLDGHRIDYVIPGESNHLDLHSKLYVGGIDKEGEGHVLPKELWAGILSSGYDKNSEFPLSFVFLLLSVGQFYFRSLPSRGYNQQIHYLIFLPTILLAIDLMIVLSYMC